MILLHEHINQKSHTTNLMKTTYIKILEKLLALIYYNTDDLESLKTKNIQN